MDFTEVVASRKSIRDYSNKTIEPEKINKILKAAILAPSWANKQCCRFVVVTQKSKINKLSSLINPWLKDAPVVIVACADPENSGSKNGMDYYLVDVGISLQQLILAATDLGLGTCWIGGFNETKIKKILEIPDHIKVVAMTPIGYRKERESFRSRISKKIIGSNKRIPFEKVVHKEKW